MHKHPNGANMTDNPHKESGTRNGRQGASGDAKYAVEHGTSSHDFHRAVERLEASLRDLVGYKKDAGLRQATALLDEARARLNDQIDDSEAQEPARHSGRRRYRHRRSYRRKLRKLQPGSDHLYRGPNKKIGGVCAGFARYLGVETWMARLAALTGLIFVPGLMLPAYLVACFVMDSEPTHRQPTARRARSTRTGRRRHEPGADSDDVNAFEVDHDAREAPQWPPRKMLTHSRAELAQAELRLRRIESFVTSEQYELYKQLEKMEQ